MLAAFDVLLAQPLILVIVLAVGAGIGMSIEKMSARDERRRRGAYWAGRNVAKKRGIASRNKPIREIEVRKSDFAADRLKFVMDAEFTARALLNRSEALVFRSLDKAVVERNPTWQVMAQVSMGEFLASEDAQAFSCINSKRVDFALMDAIYCVRHVVEYQGTGHDLPGAGAAARDAVKKAAVGKAGIGFHEVKAGQTTPGDLKSLIDRLVPCPEASHSSKRVEPSHSIPVQAFDRKQEPVRPG